MTTRYTLTDIRASFGVELNSVNTDPQLIDPAAGDFRPRTALAIHSVGPERPGVRFPKRLNNRAEALKWLIYGEVV